MYQSSLPPKPPKPVLPIKPKFVEVSKSAISSPINPENGEQIVFNEIKAGIPRNSSSDATSQAGGLMSATLWELPQKSVQTDGLASPEKSNLRNLGVNEGQQAGRLYRPPASSRSRGTQSAPSSPLRSSPPSKDQMRQTQSENNLTRISKPEDPGYTAVGPIINREAKQVRFAPGETTVDSEKKVPPTPPPKPPRIGQITDNISLQTSDEQSADSNYAAIKPLQTGQAADPSEEEKPPMLPPRTQASKVLIDHNEGRPAEYSSITEYHDVRTPDGEDNVAGTPDGEDSSNLNVQEPQSWRQKIKQGVANFLSRGKADNAAIQTPTDLGDNEYYDVKAPSEKNPNEGTATAPNPEGQSNDNSNLNVQGSRNWRQKIKQGVTNFFSRWKRADNAAIQTRAEDNNIKWYQRLWNSVRPKPYQDL